MTAPKTELIVALDAPDTREAMKLVDSLDIRVRWYKVGLELFTAEGPAIVRLLRQSHWVMLDLKLHDIPETVARAVKTAIDVGADMLTIHTSGGRKMMDAAAKAANGKIKLLGVTVLTSMDDKDLSEVGVAKTRLGGTGEGFAEADVGEQVRRLAELAGQCGLDGLVCSALEAADLHTRHPGFALVVPGIRPAGSDAGDQKRVATPAKARQDGASFIVVGRPIRDAPDRKVALTSILAELEG